MAQTLQTSPAMQSLDNLPVEQRRMLGVDLCALLQIDVDALHVYDAVLGAIGDADIRRQVEVYRGDHERHVQEIRGLLDVMTIPVPDEQPSTLAMALVEEIDALVDEGDILMRFLLNEHLSSAKYGECVRNAGYLPEEFLRIAVAGASDENRHFRWAMERIQEIPGMQVDLGPMLGLHEEMECILGDVQH